MRGKNIRKSGVLVHITSLPSKFGIGDVGYSAKNFIDLLKNSSQKLMQILPIGPTEPFFDNSPYHSVSAFAINPLFISLEKLKEEGLLESNLSDYEVVESNIVPFGEVIENKFRAFGVAFKNFKESDEFEKFCAENSFWLDDYANFTALKKRFGNKPWQEWPLEFKNRDKVALNLAKDILKDEIRFVKFLQFIAYKQLLEMKAYANENGIEIIGDLPIYVDLDSPDVWANRELFNLNEEGYPIKVAGVPPDYFNENGQLWGNPVYNWDKHKEIGFEWWIRRISHLLKFVDIVRIDHFRGFVAYYAIDAGRENAKVGDWIRVPVYEFFDAIKNHFPSMPFIAEDLGLITEDVVEVIEHYNIPNMRILQFAFDGSPENGYLPHNYKNPTVVYTGTHDHNTTVGWFKYELTEKGKEYLEKYLGKAITIQTINFDLIRLAHSSIAQFSIVPVQDVLGLDERFRVNTPGTSTGNWRFKLKFSDIDEEKFLQLKEITEVYGR
ncbi:4-alpha-glucanotransferase [Caldisericum exile]|uniref:4-alpha-glucanotransferase n=1 Tax=Caldisericum exile (strain DSM 21853 / NBRC 104410 / AZM16c01) TaxID=511051 RepID=A0A7U6JGZ3_CALEA|nr:4-alpha-glucanotransferase [Caldisericum exile]BAL81067.1 4-alpha-glucanotransferase [Caldisericum exile AZM16c01]